MTLILYKVLFKRQRLHEILKLHFKGTSAQEFVQRNDFVIASKDNKHQIRPWEFQQIEWGSIVTKGEEIVMSVVVKKVQLESESAKLQETTCPECYRTEIGVMPDDDWFQWYASFYGWAAIP